MKQKIVLLLITGGLLLVLTAAAVSSPLALGVSWWTIDGGGGTSTGGPYALSGTIGQPDARFSHDGEWEVRGGFWSADDGGKVVHLPLVTQP